MDSRLIQERDLFRSLLELGLREADDGLLAESLRLVVAATGARRGYLAVAGEDGAPARWWIATGFSDEELADVHTRVSSGVIAAAMATSTTVVSDSARTDPRFNAQASVLMHRIESVLCVPLGPGPSLGVLYLQDRAAQDRAGGVFDEADRARAEAFGRYITPHIERLRLRARQEEDPTRGLRARLSVTGIIGRSPVLAELLGQIEAASRFAVPVLLTGASGTGKTVVARAIHHNSPRSEGPFIELNVATLPEALFESELFGALPGAHSTATRRVIGKVEAAEGGTLFLDEIGELPLGVQAKLLQLLQSREYYPLGASAPHRANLRFIAATNIDLGRAVEARTFREDLYWRLNVLRLRVPSLADRREDIPALAAHLVDRAARRNDLGPLALAPSALAALQTADWPGNVRQLEHAVEVGAIRAAMEGAARIEVRHLFPDSAPVATDDGEAGLTLQEATRRLHRRLLQQTLQATGWNISETARRLDVTRVHVRNLIQAFGLRGA